MGLSFASAGKQALRQPYLLIRDFLVGVHVFRISHATACSGVHQGILLDIVVFLKNCFLKSFLELSRVTRPTELIHSW